MHVEVAKVELRWFYGEAEGELGLRAASIEPGLGEAADPHERASKRLGSASRWSDVASRLRAIGATHERVLRLAYTPHTWAGMGDWYELAGVAAWLLAGDDDEAAAPALARATDDVQALEGLAKRLEARRLHLASLDLDVLQELGRRRARVDALRRASSESVVEVSRRIPRLPAEQATKLRDRAKVALALALTAFREVTRG